MSLFQIMTCSRLNTEDQTISSRKFSGQQEVFKPEHRCSDPHSSPTDSVLLWLNLLAFRHSMKKHHRRIVIPTYLCYLLVLRCVLLLVLLVALLRWVHYFKGTLDWDHARCLFQSKIEGTIWKDVDELKVFKVLDLEEFQKTFSAYQKPQVTRHTLTVCVD